MIALLLVLLAATEVPSFKGTLCFSDSKSCVATEAASVTIEASEKPRTWVWTSADTSRIVFGELEAKAATLDLEPKKSRHVTLSLGGSAQRGWPGDVDVTVTQGKEKRWESKIPSSSVRKLRELTIPEGNYVVLLASTRHLPERRPLRPTGDMTLGTVELKPLPAIHGRVVTTQEGKRVALAGAQIARTDGKLLTTAGPDGTFDAELNVPVPEEILLFHPGVATRVVSLKTDARRAEISAENDLGEIVMESGVRLVLHIVRSGEAIGKKVRVRLLNDVKQKYQLVPITSREVAADQEEIAFGDLAKGTYFVAVEGDKPLEFLTRTVELKEEETSETIDIKPYRVVGTIRFGEEPLREGDVGISATRMQREMKLLIDEEGHFGAVLWQSGKLHGWVNSKALGSIVPLESPELGDDPSTWSITLRRRLIEGRVLDAETNQPVKGASMRLEKTGEAPSRNRLYTSVNVGEDGRYAIAAIDNGTYDIKVEHPERIPVQRTIELREADQTQAVDFPLQRGTETKIEFAWASGTPVANAQVIEGVARDGYNPLRMFTTDAGGRLTVRSERGEKRTLFVLPREGSLGVARVVAGSTSDTVRVVVSPPVGTIQVARRNREEKPQPVLVLMRFNGEWVPQSVVGRLPRDMSVPGTTRFTQLPAGTYEFWAVKPSRDNENTFAPPSREPVRVGLSGGDQRVDVPVE